MSLMMIGWKGQYLPSGEAVLRAIEVMEHRKPEMAAANDWK